LEKREGRCLIIGEVAQAHDGSLGTAHAYIDALAAAGAAAVKFQVHIASAESTPAEPWRVKFSRQDASRYDYWKRMEFTREQWAGLASHAAEKGIGFVVSPFSAEAIALVGDLGITAWKVASGEVANLPLLEIIAAHGAPVIVSSGMSPLEEVDRAVELFRSRGRQVTVLQCTSAYPCPPQKVGLNLLAELRSRYGLPVGLSDHSGTIWAGLAAALLGASCVEVHVTWSRECFGPDVSASITLEELRQMVAGIRFLEEAQASPVDKDEMARSLEPLRGLFTKSLVAARDLATGALLAGGDLATKKPGSGIPAARKDEFVGRILRRSVPRDHIFAEDDFE
jgi:N-acetylneuraminate synthase